MWLILCFRCNDMDIMISHPEQIKVTFMLRDMLCQVCDHAHDRCVKLLIARAKVSYLLNFNKYKFNFLFFIFFKKCFVIVVVPTMRMCFLLPSYCDITVNNNIHVCHNPGCLLCGSVHSYC